MENGNSLVFQNVIMELVLSSVTGWQAGIQAIMFLRGLIRIHTSGRWYWIFPGLVTLIIYGWEGLPGSVGAWKRYMGKWLLPRNFFIFSHCLSHTDQLFQWWNTQWLKAQQCKTKVFLLVPRANDSWKNCLVT